MNETSASEIWSPFAPGFGTIPEYVAGRRTELRRLRGTLQYIADNRQENGRLPRTPPAPIVLIGPRGVGKTLLLGCLGEQAEDKGVHIARLSQMADVSGGDMMAKLVQAIAGDEGEGYLERLKAVNVNLGEFGGGVEFHQKALAGFKQMLQIKLKEKSMVFLMDEVQHYHAGSLGMVLQVAQELINSKYPLMVLLAGTPDMNSLLMKIKASFVVRSEKMSINLLADEDIREGFEKPFAARRIEVKEDALQKMQSLTDGYPYFIQTVGEAVWNTLQDEQGEEKRKRVDLPLVERAIINMEKRRKMFYSDLYNEMYFEHLLPCAKQVAGIIKRNDNQPTSRGVFEAGLEQMDKGLLPDKEVTEIVSILEDRGFLWPNEEGLLGPGIPSFISFVEKMDAVEAQQKEKLLPTIEKQQQMIEGAGEEPDLLDVTRYIGAGADVDSRRLRIKVPLDLGEEWNVLAKRGGIYTVVLPNGKKGIYRVNRIEDPRDSPRRDLSSFSGIILYLGGKTDKGFDNAGVYNRPDVESWKNKSSTRK